MESDLPYTAMPPAGSAITAEKVKRALSRNMAPPPSAPAAAPSRASKIDYILGSPEPRRQKPPRLSKRTFVARMLCASSHSWQAVLYRQVITAVILFSVVLLFASTVDALYLPYKPAFAATDGVISCVFLVDYVLRAWIAAEEYHDRAMGPRWRGLLAWAFSWGALVDALATFPFFADLLDGKRTFLPFTWVRIFRLFLLLRTSRYARAVRTVHRVVFINRQILLVCLSLVGFIVLLTSSMLWLWSDEETRKLNAMESIPAAAYTAVMMLTGQGGVEGRTSCTSISCTFL